MALAQNLGAGVAACYRGTRLYDTPAAQAVVAKWVNIYKAYRDILTSDLIHIRRPDGASLDGFLHANALLATPGFALIFNPAVQALTQNITFPLYYTGLQTTARMARDGGPPQAYALERDYSVTLEITLEAQSVAYFVITGN